MQHPLPLERLHWQTRTDGTSSRQLTAHLRTSHPTFTPASHLGMLQTAFHDPGPKTTEYAGLSPGS